MMSRQLKRCALIIVVRNYGYEADPEQRTARPFDVASVHEDVEILELPQRETAVYQEGQGRPFEGHPLDVFGLERAQDRNELRRQSQATKGTGLRAIPKLAEGARRDASCAVTSEILIHQRDDRVFGG